MELRGIVAVAALALLVSVPSATTSHAAVPGSDLRSSPPSLTAYVAPIPAGGRVAPLAPATPLLLTFTLAFSNASRLSAALTAVEDPASPMYRHFLTYAQFQRAYGPSRSAVTSAAATLRAAGATEVVRAPGGSALEAVLPAELVERLLGVRLLSVSTAGGEHGYTAVGRPTLPPSLTGEVVAVDGLSRLGGGSSIASGVGPRPSMPPAAPSPAGFIKDGRSGDQWFIGTDYAQAYGAIDLLPGNMSVKDATYPSGVAVATLLASGYNQPTGTSLPPWDPAVVDAYYNETFPAGWPHPTLTGVPVSVFGAGTPLPPGSSGGLNDSLGFEVENSLDLEMAGSLAPGAHLYNFYFNGSLLVSPLAAASADQYFTADLAQALSFGYGFAKLAVVSCSFGLPDLVNGQWDSLLEEASMMGVTVVSASGDQGNSPPGANGRGEGPDPLWPAAAAFNTSGAVSVGGVTLSLSGKPTSVYTFPPITAVYDTEVDGIASAMAWWQGSSAFGTYAGTEGGVAGNYSEPYWQFHSAAQPPIVNASEIQGVGQLGRSEPDVALAANSTLASFTLGAGSMAELQPVGGTSVAAPLFAGMLADVVAVENATLPAGRTGLGFLDPELYRVASFYQAHPGPGEPFEDVLTGHNYLFEAGAGWDPLTGWGELSAPLLLQADENSTVANYVYTGPTPTLPTVRAPLFTPLVVVVIFAGAAAAVLAAVYVVFSARRGRQAPAYGPRAGYGPTPPTWDAVASPSPSYATFACPYCGFERPAEPGHCPRCGAM